MTVFIGFSVQINPARIIMLAPETLKSNNPNM